MTGELGVRQIGKLKNEHPLVSCIIIFFNCERFLAEAVESVVAQTYSNWEILLVDDGSTDGSTQIALHYVNSYRDRMHYLAHEGHENRGMSASRNLGLANAKGDYLALLDSDDVWLPHKLSEQVAILNSHPAAAMVYGTTLKWYSWTGNPDDMQRDHLYQHEVPLNTLIEPPTLLTNLLQQGTVPCPSDIMFRHDVAPTLGGFEESFRGIYDDQVFYAKVFLRAPVFVADRCWDRYRKHQGSSMSVARVSGQIDSGRLVYLNWLETYLREQNFVGTDIWKSLQQSLRPHHHPVWHRLKAGTTALSGKIRRQFEGR